MKHSNEKNDNLVSATNSNLGVDNGSACELKVSRLNRFQLFMHGSVLMLVGAVMLASAGAISGRTMVEKMLTDLVMPVGLVWAGLLLIVYFCFLMRQWWIASLGLFCWLVLTLAGNFYVSNFLISGLESPFVNVNVFEMKPLDTMVVLGGGTSSRRNGDSQLAGSGDRISTAARIYHAGLVKQLLCTGTASFRSSKAKRHPREEAVEILRGLGVPADQLFELEGINTFQEMQNLKIWLSENPDQTQIGVLSSAWHLPRVMRLARSNGLELIPVPCDFLTSPADESPNFLIPSSGAIEVTRKALKEYLASWLGR